MPALIVTINQTDAVTIKITVAFGFPWQYQYEDRGTDYKGNHLDGLPHTHAIGFPHELHLITDVWVFRLLNIGTEKTGFITKIDWFQNGTTIHTWTKEGIIEAGEALTFGDDGTIV
jgi:hypothetical protein